MAQMRVAVVTGGAQGIGKAISLRFLREGWIVVIGDVDAAAADETAAEFRSEGELLPVRADVSSEPDVRNLMSRARRRFGRIDALVNNAGLKEMATFDRLTLAKWNAVIGVNLTGAYLCARHAAPALKKAGGSIVNIASTRAVMSEGDDTAYAASKGGLLALTHSLAIALGPRVRVNCILPGWIDVAEWQKRSRRQASNLSRADHAQHPCGRVGKPEDIAALVWFLSGPEAGFITGAGYVADGGMTRKMIYV